MSPKKDSVKAMKDSYSARGVHSNPRRTAGHSGEVVVKRFSFRHRYYLGAFEEGERVKAAGKIRWSFKSAASSRISILNQARAAKPAKEEVAVGRIASHVRQKHSRLTYFQEEIKNVHTGKSYWLRYRTDGQRAAILSRLFDALELQIYDGEYWGYDDFETVQYPHEKFYQGPDHYEAPDFTELPTYAGSDMT